MEIGSHITFRKWGIIVNSKHTLSGVENNLLLDYVISLTHLYGLVPKDKVIDIYNLQNDDKVDIEMMNDVVHQANQELTDNFVKIHGNYFVAEAIMKVGEFEEQLRQRKGKPFYIPKREELLKYKEESYFEVTKEYEALRSYLTLNIFEGDEVKAEKLCEEVQGICENCFSMELIFNVFNREDVIFKNEDQVNEVLRRVMDLANNTRIWENNGHTPSEIFNMKERPNLRPLPKSGKFNKIGRNDPCPCGSGKKYKKCCGNLYSPE
ncbi:SEC-C domain-containing protein [Heliobacterium chlorum]|uniref:SEC-C domain-containing protein n=2 Tax=Heliobacterium chlorum TaxID=2698 RepID=A0ABR7T3J6_HELCL|nr:SEC-C domain-containing protein [Heliobacterium chlorum]